MIAVFVRLDVHKATISVAWPKGCAAMELVTLGSSPIVLIRSPSWWKSLARTDRQASFCYESGPCVLFRELPDTDFGNSLTGISVIPGQGFR